jgi:hypothetical protein
MRASPNTNKKKNMSHHQPQINTKPLSVIQIVDESHQNRSQINNNKTSSGNKFNFGFFNKQQQPQQQQPQQQPQQQQNNSMSVELSRDDRAASLTHGEISQYFHIPLHEAVVQLKVDETSLKKRCRQLGISRWPYRKRVNLLKESDGDDMDDGEGSPASAGIKKKPIASLFRCFNLGKKKKEPKKTPKVSDEEHFFKQYMMQQEYDNRLEPVRLDNNKGGLSRSKRLEYWKTQNQEFQLKQQQYIEKMTSQPTNQKPMQLQSQYQSPGTQEQYFEKYSHKAYPQYQPQSPQPQQQQQSMSQGGYYQKEFNPQQNYFAPVQPQQQQQMLPSINDLLSSIQQDNSKKRVRRESADQVMQEQFGHPVKKMSYYESNGSPEYSSPLQQTTGFYPPQQHNQYNGYNNQHQQQQQQPFSPYHHQHSSSIPSVRSFQF